MDGLSKEARSELMGRIKSSGTKPEEILIKALRAAGLSPSKNAQDIEGSPDAAFKRARVAVFVDGCYWHGCPQHARIPQGPSAPYWRSKLGGNVARDKDVRGALEADGWLVIRIWEHDLRSPGAAAIQADRIAEAVAARL